MYVFPSGTIELKNNRIMMTEVNYEMADGFICRCTGEFSPVDNNFYGEEEQP